MKITKKDYLAIAAAAVVVIILILSTGRETTKRVPLDDRHRRFYEAIKKGGSRADVERECIICHNPQGTPFPEKHPPKEQCLICHKLNETKK